MPISIHFAVSPCPWAWASDHLRGRSAVPEFPIIDSHVHLLNPKNLDYSWTRNAPSLNRQALPDDLMRAADPVRIDRFVFVEVDVDFPQHLEEAAWIEGLAHSDRRLAGMVAALPLERGKAVEVELDQLRRHKTLRAVRRLIQNQPDPEFCIRPDFIAGLKLLAPHDLAFDVCILHHQMPNAIKMVRQCPEVRFVLDHIGKPAIKAGIFDPWRQHLRAAQTLHCPCDRNFRLRSRHVWRRLACPGACRHLPAMGRDCRLGRRGRHGRGETQTLP
ncbi:MAG: hypothetical protein E6G89_10605 [Alphaproteobacteria bacterium]|nr:MAG: hypothetical protein E6G89_10605 [Alphaproteobacteria bacterium]